jgi:starch-binding outer membrane protein, SusD/RagB family
MKKLTKNKIYMLLWAVLIIPTACNDEFLDLLPHSAISTELAFENLEDFQTAVNGVYSGIAASSYYGKDMMLFGDFLSDNLYARIGYSNSYGNLYQFEFNSGTDYIKDFWARGYIVAIRATQIIDKIDELEEGTEKEKNTIKGEALLARSMAHFDMLRYFAKPYQRSSPSTDLGIPYREKISLDPLPRLTIQENYDRILRDLSQAYGLLPHDTVIIPNYYFSKKVADALFARIYFEMGQYPEAITHATNLINDARYRLLSGADYTRMWVEDTGAEIIFRLMITQSESTNAARIGSNFIGSTSPSPLWNVDYLPALDLMQLYDDKDDVRFSTFFRRNTGTPGGTGIQTIIRKYPTNPAFTNRGVNMAKVFRLAEMYLIRAEAYAKTNQENLALADINTLRRARIADYSDVVLNGDDLMQAIKNERRIELAFEGHRFLDLKRNGEGFKRVPQPGTLVANNIEVAPDNHRFVWPIPEPEMLVNPYLKDKQNPGY